MLVNLNEAVKAYAKQMGVTESEAKQDAMKIINDYMAQGYPRDFAEATFIEDTEDAAEQVEELTAKAKASGAEKVKAKKKGTAKITVTLKSGKKATCTIKVIKKPKKILL